MDTQQQVSPPSPSARASSRCLTCQKAHSACSRVLPCERCLRLGKESTCAVAPPKKRGRPRKEPRRQRDSKTPETTHNELASSQEDLNQAASAPEPDQDVKQDALEWDSSNRLMRLILRELEKVRREHRRMSRRLAGLANRGADLARLLDALEDQRRCSTAHDPSQGSLRRKFDGLLSQPSGLASPDCPEEEEGSWSSCSPMPVAEAPDLFEQCVPHPAPPFQPFLRSQSAHQALAFLNEFDFSNRRCVVRDLRQPIMAMRLYEPSCFDEVAEPCVTYATPALCTFLNYQPGEMNGMTCSSVNLLHFDTMASSLALALSKPAHQVGEVFAIASCWVTKSGHLEANDAQVQILYSPAGLAKWVLVVGGKGTGILQQPLHTSAFLLRDPATREELRRAVAARLGLSPRAV